MSCQMLNRQTPGRCASPTKKWMDDDFFRGPTHSSPPASANTMSRTSRPLTATAVAFLTSAYVHQKPVPTLELTPEWAIGEHRPDGAQQILPVSFVADPHHSTASRPLRQPEFRLNAILTHTLVGIWLRPRVAHLAAAPQLVATGPTP